MKWNKYKGDFYFEKKYAYFPIKLNVYESIWLEHYYVFMVDSNKAGIFRVGRKKAPTYSCIRKFQDEEILKSLVTDFYTDRRKIVVYDEFKKWLNESFYQKIDAIIK